MLARQESDLVIAAQSGNRNAFEQLVTRYQNLITSLAFSKTGDLQRSEDIAQQAFLTAWEKKDELRDPARFGGWLRSIVRNVTLNSNRHFNRLDRSAQSLNSFDEPVRRQDRPEDVLATNEQQAMLWASLKNIPEQYREPLVLFYREDKSVAQVAELMDLSVDAVKKRLSRGRAMLKAEVEQFVEDLLGASKPSPSFASGVMVTIPAVASSTAGKIAAQTGTAFGAKSMLGNAGVFLTGPIIGVLGGLMGGVFGVAGAWFGIKTAEKHATSPEEKDLLWWYFSAVTVITISLTAIGVAASLLVPVGGFKVACLIFIAVAYAASIIGLTFYFVKRQSLLHQKHGMPTYVENHLANKPNEQSIFRIRILSDTVGCWAWLVVSACTKLDWVALGVSLLTMSIILTIRLTKAKFHSTQAQQHRSQAKSVFINLVMTGLIAFAAPSLGAKLNFDPIPAWAMGSFVVVVGICIATLLLSRAKKLEKIELEARGNLSS